MKRVLGSASPKLRSAAPAVAFAILYFLTATLTDRLIGDAGIAVLWPVSGVYLGVMLLAPHRMWPMLAAAAGVGSLAAYLYGGSSFEVSLAFAVPSSAEGLLGALLVERIVRKRFTLRGMHDLLALVLGGAVVANGLVAISAGAVAAQTFDASFAESWLRWWSADALGILAVTPIITAPLREGHRGRARLWSPARVAALGGLALGMIAMQLVSHGSDLVTGAGDVGDQVYMVQAFLAGLQIVSLALAVSVTERERLRDELGSADAELDGSVERLDDARRRIAQLNAELAGRRAELVQAERRSERVASELRESEAARRRSERELGHTKKALTVSQEELDELVRDLGLTTADRDRVQGELDASAEAAKQARAELSSAAEELSRARAETRAHREQTERARADSAALREELESAHAENGALREELERASAEGGAHRDELERAHAESGALREELERASAEGGAAAERLERALAERDALAGELERTRVGQRESRERVRAEQDALQRELGDARASGRALQERLERAQAQATAHQKALEEARATIGMLEERTRRAPAEREEALAAMAKRVEGLEQELEQSRRAHRDAELALDHARARFNERRERLERSLGEGGREAGRAQVAAPAPELSSRYDERGVCESASLGFAQLLGYEPHELVGRPGAELLHPDDLPRLARARASKSPSRFEARLRRKAGGFVWVEVSLEPVLSSAYGKLVSLTTTVRELPARSVAA
jgi:PAS domain S-box-containing protein